MAEDTVKRNRRQYEWKKQNGDRINFMMPKGMKEQIQEAANAAGVSPSEWIRRAITEKLEEQQPENQVEK